MLSAFPHCASISFPHASAMRSTRLSARSRLRDARYKDSWQMRLNWSSWACMQVSTRPSPRVTLGQNLLISDAQALSTAWTPAATRSARLDCWADKLEHVQTNANTAAETVAVVALVIMINLPFHQKPLKDIERSRKRAA